MALPARDNWAEALERELSFHGLIGVMFSRAWSCCSSHTGLSGAGLMVEAGRVGHGYQACREMICSPHPLPLGAPTVTHGTLVTRSLHCCGTTGGAGLIIWREVMESEGEADLPSHFFTRDDKVLYIQELFF